MILKQINNLDKIQHKQLIKIKIHLELMQFKTFNNLLNMNKILMTFKKAKDQFKIINPNNIKINKLCHLQLKIILYQDNYPTIILNKNFNLI